MRNKIIISFVAIVVLFIFMSCSLTTFSIGSREIVTMTQPDNIKVIGHDEAEGFISKFAIKPFMCRNVDLSPLVNQMFQKYPTAKGIANFKIISKVTFIEAILPIILWFGETVYVEGDMFEWTTTSSIDKSNLTYTLSEDGNGKNNINIQGFLLKKDAEEALKNVMTELNNH